MDIYKIIITGSKSFNDYNSLERVCNEFINEKREEGYEIIIVCGYDGGVDSLAERYAKENGYLIPPFPIKWGDIEGKFPHSIGERSNGAKYWKGAAYHRNEQMAIYSNILIYFWDENIPKLPLPDIIKKAYKYNIKVNYIIKE